MINNANQNRKNPRSINRSLIPKVKNDIYFITSDQYKYIKYLNCNEEEYYDLLNDPYEQKNIFDENEIKCKNMMLLLENFIEQINNLENIKKLITKREKNIIKKAINNVYQNES